MLVMICVRTVCKGYHEQMTYVVANKKRVIAFYILICQFKASTCLVQADLTNPLLVSGRRFAQAKEYICFRLHEKN